MSNITVIGTPTQQQVVKDALALATVDLDAKLRNPYRIEFHTAAEFMAAGRIIPGSKNERFPQGRSAWGYVVSNRVLWVNGNLRAGRQRYTVIHELGHAIDSDYLTPAKKLELMAMMPGKPTDWRGGAYAMKPREIYADALTEAVGIDSPLDSFYGDIGDLPKVLEITFRPDVIPPVPDPEPPDPLPIPDPEVALLKAQVASLTAQNTELAANLATANKRITDKDAKASELLLL